MIGRHLGYGSCLLLAFGHITSSTSQAMSSLSSLAKQWGNISLHAVSNSVCTSPEEASGHEADGHKLSSAILKELLNWTKKWGVLWQVQCNKSIMVGELDQSSLMETDIIPDDNKLGLLWPVLDFCVMMCPENKK